MRIGRSERGSFAVKPLALSAAVEAWLEDCQARGLSPSTVGRSYSQATRGILLPWCTEHGISRVAELDAAAVARLAVDLNARKVSKWTVAHYLRTINQFLGWLDAKRERAPMPRTRKVARDVLTLAEMRQLEQAANSIRDGLVIRLLTDTGAREGELANARLEDVVKRGGSAYLLVRGKTGERMAPISAEVYARAKAYASHQRPHSASERLLIGERRDRRSKAYEPLTPSGIYQVVKDTSVRAGMADRRIYPHLLRHAAITHAVVVRHMHPALASEIFGVSVAVIAAHYTHASDADRHRAMMSVLADD